MTTTMIASLGSGSLSRFGTIVVLSTSTTAQNSYRTHLTDAGGSVLCVDDASEALRVVDSRNPGLLLVDTQRVDLPMVDFIRSLRRRGPTVRTMIFVVSATFSTEDHLAALQSGADDYLSKPFAMEVLIARLAALRRRYIAGAAAAMEIDRNQDTSLTFGEIVLVPGKYEVFVGGERIYLTLTEFRLLQLLMSAPGRVRTRAEMQAFLGSAHLDTMDRTVDSHMARLRRKLGRASRFIKTIRGVGYRLMRREPKSESSEYDF